MDVDLDARLRDAAQHGCFRYASSLQLHAFNGAPHLFRQPSQQLSDVMGAFGVGVVVLRHDLGTFVDRNARSRSGPAQIVDELVPGDRMHPRRKELARVIGVALEVNGK